MAKKTAKTAKKRPNPREGLDRPYNGGQWTKSRFQTFIVAAIRQAHSRWGPKFVCIKDAYIEDGINPATGKKCKLHRCPQCEELFPQGMMRADHNIPVVGPEGFVDWNTLIDRMFKEKDGYNAICKECHEKFSKHENALRAAYKANQIQ